MSYGTSSIDFGKAIVLISCIFPLFMFALIVKDPIAVIHYENGGGWWDTLKEAYAAGDEKVAIYPRIWATFLLFQAIVRLNWVFTIETTPSLYRCVLLSYVLPFAQYAIEVYVFKTLPPFDSTSTFLISVGPWIAIAIGYPKYTKEAIPAGKVKV